MPNMLIAAPGDPLEVRACLRYLVKNPQPSYLRLGKAGEPSFHLDTPEVTPGLWLKIAGDGNNESLLCTGATLELGMNLRNDLKNYFQFSVFSMPLWGMKYKSIQSSQVCRVPRVITLEDHLEDGGFGSWLLESLSRESKLRDKVEIKALNEIVCGAVASQLTLNSLGGLK